MSKTRVDMSGVPKWLIIAKYINENIAVTNTTIIAATINNIYNSMCNINNYSS